MPWLIKLACKISNLLTEALNALASVGTLAVRLYLLKVFFLSGWLKLTTWSSTLYLFQHEYKIVGISPPLAAYIGTAAELVLPILLVLGFGARLPALALFVFNIFNVIFYPLLLKPEYASALKDHYIWGILIGIIVLYGHGKISLDYWIQKKICKEYKY